jgi:hypothetical protein
VFAGAIMGVTTAIVWNIVNASDITTLSGAAALSMTSMFTGGVNPGILLDILMGTVAFIGGCWFLGQAIKHTTGINLGAHSLSTMVAGGIGLAKLAPMASGAFGMGAKAMGALRGTQQGSSLAGAAATNPQAASVSGGGNLGLASPSGGPSIGATLVNQPQAVLSSFQEAVFSTPDQGKSIIEAAVPASTLAAATAGLAPGSPEYKQAAFTAYAQTERAGQDFSLITMGAPRVSSMA